MTKEDIFIGMRVEISTGCTGSAAWRKGTIDTIETIKGKTVVAVTYDIPTSDSIDDIITELDRKRSISPNNHFHKVISNVVED